MSSSSHGNPKLLAEKYQKQIKDLSKQSKSLDKKIAATERQLLKLRLDNSCWYPLCVLKNYKGHEDEIWNVSFVAEEDDGTLFIKEIFNDELLTISDDGTFEFSSFENGIIDYDEEKKRYVHHYHHYETDLPKLVGIYEIEIHGGSKIKSLKPLNPKHN